MKYPKHDFGKLGFQNLFHHKVEFHFKSPFLGMLIFHSNQKHNLFCIQLGSTHICVILTRRQKFDFPNISIYGLNKGSKEFQNKILQQDS